MAIQYAKAMGYHVAAVDVSDEKAALARQFGADAAVNAKTTNAAEAIARETGVGAHGVLITAVSPIAFRQGIDMLRRGGTGVLIGLPPGDFAAPIFDVVLKGLTIRGSIVGTRKDLHEALQFAAGGKVKATITTRPLDAINESFDELKRGVVQGRIVLDLALA